MKPKISEDPKNCRISTYLTKDEAEMLAEKIGTQSTASWLRKLLLNAIYGEIERLTEENGWLSKECNKSTAECAELQKQVDKAYNSIEKIGRNAHKMCTDLEDKNRALQEQVDELTDEKDKYQEKWQTSYMNELNLQKQVDELTDKLGKVLSGIKADEFLVARGVEQAVKDTAKEIFEKIFLYRNRKDTINFDNILLNMAKDYGVEVNE